MCACFPCLCPPPSFTPAACSCLHARFATPERSWSANYVRACSPHLCPLPSHTPCLLLPTRQIYNHLELMECKYHVCVLPLLLLFTLSTPMPAFALSPIPPARSATTRS